MLRVISAFHHDRHAFSLEPRWFKTKFQRLVLTADIQLATYSSLQAIGNCYTKQLTGRSCADPEFTGEATLQEAVRRVELLDFVGITEQWKASVCLFHAQFGLIPPNYEREGLNVRPGSYSHDLAAVPLEVQELIMFNERQDFEVYRRANATFHTKLQNHPECSKFLVGDGA